MYSSFHGIVLLGRPILLFIVTMTQSDVRYHNVAMIASIAYFYRGLWDSCTDAITMVLVYRHLIYDLGWDIES